MTMPAPHDSARYQGRALARPQEELTDQGLGFDLTTMLSRRSALCIFGVAVAGLGMAALQHSSAHKLAFRLGLGDGLDRGDP